MNEKRMFPAAVLVFCILAAILILGFSAGKVRAIELTGLEVSAVFAPPHNEPVVQDMVARYKAEFDGGVRFWKRVTFDANARVWFLQEWRTPETVGHGFPEAWKGTDWNFERVRMDYNLKLGVDVLGPVQVFVEHNKWDYLTRAKPSDHSSEYYWMTGFRFKYR